MTLDANHNMHQQQAVVMLSSSQWLEALGDCTCVNVWSGMSAQKCFSGGSTYVKGVSGKWIMGVPREALIAVLADVFGGITLCTITECDPHHPPHAAPFMPPYLEGLSSHIHHMLCHHAGSCHNITCSAGRVLLAYN